MASLSTVAVPSTGTLATTAGTQALTNKTIDGSQLVNASVDLSTKATTLTGLTLPSLKTDRFPFREIFVVSNITAGVTARPLPTVMAAGFGPSVVVAGLAVTIVGYSLVVDTTNYTSAENSHDNTEYTGWTTGTIDVDIAASDDGVTAMSQRLSLFTGLDKATVAAFNGRWDKNKTFAVTPVTIPAGAEIIARVTTSAGWNGTGLEMAIHLYGYLSNV